MVVFLAASWLGCQPSPVSEDCAAQILAELDERGLSCEPGPWDEIMRDPETGLIDTIIDSSGPFYLACTPSLALFLGCPELCEGEDELCITGTMTPPLTEGMTTECRDTWSDEVVTVSVPGDVVRADATGYSVYSTTFVRGRDIPEQLQLSVLNANLQSGDELLGKRRTITVDVSDVHKPLLLEQTEAEFSCATRVAPTVPVDSVQRPGSS